ncbi:hypothetical protein GQ55_9G554600 [Panicum hallii var. hallii]|uniref:Uncharacterized protein n=1 Tax=Panicum hallii var. hallii TaxID=1504633 RepID=A0A2T7CFF3_9POAL|nr:hypothetical protein GQ55_9G554600 [Panicum hallii var. hallii]
MPGTIDRNAMAGIPALLQWTRAEGNMPTCYSSYVQWTWNVQTVRREEGGSR